MAQLGKYSTDRDNILHFMATCDWANESFGDVDAPTGYVLRMSNTFQDVQPSNTELTSLIEDQVKAYDIVDNDDFRESLVGHFLIWEDASGFVSVLQFATELDLLDVYKDLETEFSEWDSQDD